MVLFNNLTKQITNLRNYEGQKVVTDHSGGSRVFGGGDNYPLCGTQTSKLTDNLYKGKAIYYLNAFLQKFISHQEKQCCLHGWYREKNKNDAKTDDKVFPDLSCGKTEFHKFDASYKQIMWLHLRKLINTHRQNFYDLVSNKVVF